MKTIVLILGSLCSLWMNMGQVISEETVVSSHTEQYMQDNDREDDEPVILNCNLKRPNGLPYQGASVELYVTGEATPAHSGTTNSSGTVTFPSVIPRSYRYKVSATGYQNIDKTIVVPTVNTTRTDTLVE